MDENETAEVQAVLKDGDLIAVPAGTMFELHRVCNDPVSGETSFEHQCMAVATGAHNVFRTWPLFDSSAPSALPEQKT
jgi:hypothetical protein